MASETDDVGISEVFQVRSRELNEYLALKMVEQYQS